MKRKIFSVLFALVLACSLGLVTSVPAGAQDEMPDVIVFPFELGGKADGNYVAEYSTTQANTGSSSVHLQTTGDVGNGDEARIRIDFTIIPAGDQPTLGEIESISWYEYLVDGYPPHVDIYVDIDGDGTADDALVIEYAYNNEIHCASGWPTYGALTGAWYQTFSDDGDGPTVIDDTANAWLNSGPPGPLTGPGSENFIYGTLAEWKAGTVDPSIDADTAVTALEIEVDNWIVQTEAYVDDITATGVGQPPILFSGQIQDAVDTVGTDALINVAPGTYNEDLVIASDKTGLELAGASGATIKGVSLSEWGVSTLPNIDVLADNVSIHGFTIQGPEPSGTLFAAGMIIGAQDIEIYNNAFEVNNASDETNADDVCQGIVAYNQLAIPGVDISGLSIHDNTFTHRGAGTIGYEGIYINRDAGTGNITIADNVFTGAIIRGITVERSNATISGNSLIPTVASWAWTGVLVMDIGSGEPQDSVSVVGNTIEGFDNGVKLGDSSHTQVLTNISITENTLQGNGTGVLVRSSAEGVAVNCNNIDGSTTYGVQNTDTSNTLDAEDNWWGNASGPIPNVAPPYTSYGDVVTPSAYVDYDPWLLEVVVPEVTPTTFQNTLALKDGWTLVSTDKEVTTGSDWTATLAYKYTADSGYTQVTLATQLTSVDAYYLKTSGGGGVGINYSTSAPGVVTKTLGAGWNTISCAGETDAYKLLSQLRYVQIGEQQGVGITNLIGQGSYNQFLPSISIPLVADVEWVNISPGGTPIPLNAFDGFWVYMNADKIFGVIPD